MIYVHDGRSWATKWHIVPDATEEPLQETALCGHWGFDGVWASSMPAMPPGRERFVCKRCKRRAQSGGTASSVEEKAP